MMGFLNLFGFQRKKTTYEVIENLNSINTKIDIINKDCTTKAKVQQWLNSYTNCRIVCVYTLFLLLFDLCVYTGTGQSYVFSLLACILILILIIGLLFRCCILCYYKKTIEKNTIALKKMRKEKREILEDLMENEPYNVAKGVLDKYGTPDEQSKALSSCVLNIDESSPLQV